jgi:glycine/D-amino acid oxidase-like deaminating enzyme/nitrite reductase/ring-hydroxylating ferredoxin subunit
MEESMHTNANGSKSLWMEVPSHSYPILEKNTRVDVCIVGAGIVGLTCAYTLLKQGKSVIIVDQGDLSSGQSARTTAHLTWVLDDRYCHLEKLFGEEGIKLIAESHDAAINYIEKIILEEKIDCDFLRVNGYLFVPPNESKDILDKELTAISKTRMQCKKIDRAPFSHTFDTGTCLLFTNQAQFHLMKYLTSLAEAIIQLGGKIYSNTHVSSFEDGAPCIVKTSTSLEITAQSVIVATCTPVNDRMIIHTKQAAYRTYVIAGSVPKGSVPFALYWDTADPYHYIRVQKHISDPNLEWLIIGGEDHRTGEDPEIEQKYDHLEKWAKQRFSVLDQIEFRWSGQVFEPVDSLAFIGKNPGDKNIYIATGDSGNGLTHGTIAGILLPDLILGKDNPWKKLYEPNRKSLRASLDFIEETLNTFWQYRDWFTPGDKETIEKLSPGEGIIIRNGLQKFAIFKDNEGKVHASSAVCPHLGGCVRWNRGEKSWDCPCHGSRFDGYGKLINGPSISDLKTHEEYPKK